MEDSKELDVLQEKSTEKESAQPEKKPKKARKLLTFLGGAVLGGAAATGVCYILSGGMLFAQGLLSEETVSKLQTLQNLISQHYYKADEVTQEQLADGLYKGLLESLDDPYSVYYDEDDVASLNESVSGSYSGIGAYVSKDETTDCPKIAGVIAGAPAEAAGLQEDDILWKADGESLQGLDLDMAVSKIRGEEGTTVKLTIVRDGEEMEVEVTRDEVHSETAAGKMLEDGMGCIQISQFTDATPEQFEEALQTLQEDDLQGLIIDLRGNPGGTVEAVTEIAEYLIPEGKIFYMEYPDGSTKEYTTDGKNYIDLPIVVLVNGNSASASEILSSSIQDSGSGTVIGTQTYGKGVVQTVYSLTDGTAVKLTIAEYFTRNGNTINKIGVTPDEVVEFDSDAYQQQDRYDNQLEKAKEILKSKMQES